MQSQGDSIKLWKTVLLLALLGLAYNALYFNRGIELTDEGYEIYASYRIFQGQVPYRDFFVFYTPGAYFIHALMFGLFGPHLLVGRIEMLLIGSTLPIIVYLMARQLLPSRWAFLAGMVAVFWGTSHWPTPMASWYALFWSVLSIACLAAYLSTGRLVWIMFGGLLAGLSVVFKQNFGALTVLPSVLFLVSLPRSGVSGTMPFFFCFDMPIVNPFPVHFPSGRPCRLMFSLLANGSALSASCSSICHCW